MKLSILDEDNHLIVLNKPANVVVQGSSDAHGSLLESVKAYLKDKYHKPGNVFVGVVSRLDAMVTGVVPFARTSKGAARLSEQMRERKVRKIYWGLLQGQLAADHGTLKHWLVRKESETQTRVYDSPRGDAQLGILHYRIIDRSDLGTWVAIKLETGRKHQIRAQWSAVGAPLWGDVKYGGSGLENGMIGLHCRSFSCQHPTLKEERRWVAPVPDNWKGVFRQVKFGQAIEKLADPSHDYFD